MWVAAEGLKAMQHGYIMKSEPEVTTKSSAGEDSVASSCLEGFRL